MKLTELLRTTNLLKLMTALSIIAIVAIALTVTALYQLALEQHSELLTENLNNQIVLMRTMQQLEEEDIKDENAGGMLIKNVITHMQHLNEHAEISGTRHKLAVAELRNGQMVHLLSDASSQHEHEPGLEHDLGLEHEHHEDNKALSVPFDTELGEPMRRALSGETGVLIGLDHRGTKVLAAYQYIPEYKLGIVAKIEINQILTPYLLIFLFASSVAILFVITGGYAFAVSVKPFYASSEEKANRLRKQHEIMSRLVEKKDADPCDMEIIFNEVTQATCEGLNTSRVSIWLYGETHNNIHCATSYNQVSDTYEILDDMEITKYPAYFKALADGPIIIGSNAVSDPRTSELTRDYLLPSDTRALLDLTIWVEGENFGHLCCQQTGSDREWILEDQNFARSTADHVAMAIANCRRNKAELFLKESEKRYELAVTGSNDGLWDWDINSSNIYRSPQYKKLLGYEIDELDGDYDTLLKHLHPDDRDRDMHALNQHLDNADIPYDVEYRLLTKSGYYRWFRCRGSALRDKDGKPYRVSGSIMDITDLKQVQNNLSRFKQTLDEISENIFMFDPETLRFFYVNKSAIEITGYSEEELLEMTSLDIQPEFNEETFRKATYRLVSNPGESLTLETLQQNKNGEQIPIEVHLQYIAPIDSTPRFVAISRDISERRNAEIQNYVQRTMLEHIYKVQDDFISGENRQKVFEQLLNGFLDITESEFGFIGEVIYPQNQPPYLLTHTITNIAWNKEMRALYDQQIVEGLEFRRLDTLFGSVITTGETVLSNDPSNDPRSGGLPEGHPPLESFLGIPLKLGNKLMGMVGIANRTGGYNEDLLKQLQPLLLTCISLLDADRAEKLRNSMEQALIIAKNEAEQANRTKSEFLSSMSHELRTPLNAIMGFAQLLQLDTALSSTQNKHSKEIYSAGNLLLDLINDVLDLAKIEAGYIDLSVEPVELEHTLKDCFKLTQPQAEKNAIKLSYESNTSNDNCCKELWVLADNTRLKQILLNLLSNAIKYNRKGGFVYVCCQPTTEGFHRISVTDNGQGIKKQNLGNLFQPFNRLGEERGEIEGTGIGLVITRKLVELMGGSISVESEYGKGTSFMLDLPAAEAVAIFDDKTNRQPQKLTAINQERIRILVAEDNLTNQELITLQLDTLGYQADIVANGKEALDMLRKHDYALLLTDIHMPEMDGYQLTRAIRNSANGTTSDITIIAITANAAADEASHCLEQGMNDYLSKPVNINELQHKLIQWLPGTENKTREKTTSDVQDISKIESHSEAPAIADEQSEVAIDTEMLTRYVGNDPVKHKHFFKLFLDTAPETITGIHQAHKDRSFSGIKDTCHKLKSSSRAIGALRLSTLCQNLETASTNEDWGFIGGAMPDIDSAMTEVENYIQEQLGEKKEQQVKFAFDDVLIVDDDRFVLDLVTSRLNSMGINNVMTTSSGEEALSFIINSSTPPSILLLDLNMPGMDGVEFLRHLSEFSYQGNIILISGEDTRLLRSAENIARDRSLNILGALEKPITIPPLTELLLLVGGEKKVRPMRDKILLTKDDLSNGIKNDELVVYYQPQINLENKQFSGVEALVRWIHPERGMIPPDAFIPVAEEFHLINNMTDIILDKAMQQCSSWQEQGLDIDLSVNISVDSLDRLDLPEYIVKCAEQNELNVSKIMLEITESRLMQDITSALDILTRLSLKGIGLSIDDFGTGYSSMEQLQRVPFKELKIDRSFVNSAIHNRAARAILESSVELAQKLNMTIVAEGVETDENLSLVEGLGCTSAQGYFIGKPMPGDEIIDWYEEWKSKN